MEEPRSSGGPEETSSGEAKQAGRPEGAAIPDIDAVGVVLTCVNLLASKAWEAMGLVANPATQRIDRRLDDAQLAIDGVAALVETARGRLPDRERREVENLLMTLRLNFVEQKSKGESPGTNLR